MEVCLVGEERAEGGAREVVSVTCGFELTGEEGECAGEGVVCGVG